MSGGFCAPSLAGERDALVNFREWNAAVDRVERERGVEAAHFRLRPSAVGLKREAFDARLILRDEHVVAERLDLFVALELLAAVVGFGRARENLEDDGRIEQHVAVLVLEGRLAAGDREIWVGVKSGLARADFHVRREAAARRAPQLRADDDREVETDRAVRRALSGHRVNEAVEIFVTNL